MLNAHDRTTLLRLLKWCEQCEQNMASTFIGETSALSVLLTVRAITAELDTLSTIVTIMDSGRDWDQGTLAAVAEVLNCAGYHVREPQ